MKKSSDVEDVLKKTKEMFDHFTNYLTQTKLDHLKVNYTTPQGTLGQWEMACVTSPKDPANMSNAELNATLNKSWTYTLTVYEEKIETDFCGLKLSHDLSQFKQFHDLYKKNLEIYINLSKMYAPK